MSETQCDGPSCEGCQRDERGTDLCFPQEGYEYMKPTKNESTERSAVVTVRTDASGEKCSEQCPQMIKCSKDSNLQLAEAGEHTKNHYFRIRSDACRAAEVKVDENVLELCEVSECVQIDPSALFNSVGLFDDIRKVTRAYLKFVKAARSGRSGRSRK